MASEIRPKCLPHYSFNLRFGLIFNFPRTKHPFLNKVKRRPLSYHSSRFCISSASSPALFFSSVTFSPRHIACDCVLFLSQALLSLTQLYRDPCLASETRIRLLSFAQPYSSQPGRHGTLLNKPLQLATFILPRIHHGWHREARGSQQSTSSSRDAALGTCAVPSFPLRNTLTSR